MEEMEYQQIIEQWKLEHKELIKGGKCKKVFLDNLPIWEDTENKGSIKWEQTLGYFVYFIYGNIDGYIKITDYTMLGQKIMIEYNKESMLIATGNFHYCKIGKLLKKKTSDFKIEIGTRFQDKKRDLIITDKTKIQDKKGQWYKYYKCKCNKCGFDGGKHYSTKDKEFKDEYWIVESQLIGDREIGCSCCCINPKIVVKGINDVATMHPHLIKYFVNIEDAYTHTYSSNVPVLMKCPDCGFEKEIKINNLYCKGFSCPKCGDKTPYPEKIMFSVFSQLKIDFQTQLSKSTLNWCKDYKYDFYLNNYNILTETHGEQHYEENRRIEARTLEEEIRNDRLKKELALTNGIKKENYIVIDCRYSNLNWIKEHILESNLAKIFDLNKIDWLEAEEFALSNRVKEACNYWSNGIASSQEIANIMKLARNTVTTYLKKGSMLNWCSYDVEEVKKKNGVISSMKSRKPVVILKNNSIIKKFESFIELERMSQKIFGTKLNYNMVSQVCTGKKSQYKGYTFKYVSDLTDEELLRLEQQNLNKAI